MVNRRVAAENLSSEGVRTLAEEGPLSEVAFRGKISITEAPADKVIPTRRIAASQGWVSLGLRELWGYRDLISFFIWRDLKVRYKQTVMGMSWAIIQPLFTMVIFTLFFGRLAGVPSDGVPYPIFTYTALVPWTFFATSITLGSSSLTANVNMLKKVYFPRLTMPIATVLACLVDFIIAFAVLIGMMFFYDFALTAKALWVPVFLLLVLISALGVSFWLAALNVQYRDIRFVVPFLIQAWLFATPVVYPSSLLPEPWNTLYGINPMAGAIEAFRWALLDTDAVSVSMIVMSSLVAICLLISGAYYFRRMEKTFADVA
jgi:lipopolysaccharide transport system permease protein